MKSSSAEALQARLEALEQGQSLETVLKSHPEFEHELLPLLQTAEIAWASVDEEELEAARQRTRASLLVHARQLRATASAPAPASRVGRMLSRLSFAAALALLLLVVTGFGLTAVSAQALPGDHLYPLKRGAEQLSLRLSVNKTSRLRLSIRYEDRRLDEVRRMVSLGRIGSVRFVGRLTERSGDLWQVEGVPLLVSPRAEVDEGLSAGEFLEIQGELQTDGWILAHVIRSAGYHLSGTIERAGDGQWRIGGQDLVVLADSQVEAGLSEGDRASVTVRLADGTSVVSSIKHLPAATGEPPPPVPTATATARPPSPTSTPSPPSTRQLGGDDDQDESEERLELVGSVERIEPTRWRVDGFWYTLTEDSEIEGEIAIGSLVRVEALIRGDGLRIVEEIEQLAPQPTASAQMTPTASALPTEEGEEEADQEEEKEEEDDEEGEDGEEVSFTGQIEAMAADNWVIGGRTVHLTSDTEIDDDLQIGDEAEVRAQRQEDGSLLAEKIEQDD